MNGEFLYGLLLFCQKTLAGQRPAREVPGKIMMLRCPVLPLFLLLPAFAFAQDAGAEGKRLRRLKSYSFALSGMYGYPEMYGGGFSAGLDFRKISCSFSGSSSSLFPGSPGFRMGIASFSELPFTGTEFPLMYKYGALGRLSQKAQTEIDWKPGKGKLQVTFEGGFTKNEDSLKFSASRELFTGTAFRSILSAHEGKAGSENLSGKLNIKYGGTGSYPQFEFTSRYSDRQSDVSAENQYISWQDSSAWGFSAFLSNREKENSSQWSNTLVIPRLAIPWWKHDKSEGFRYDRKKRARLYLRSTMNMQRRDAIFDRRMNLIPDSGSTVSDIDRLYAMNSRLSGQEVTGTLTLDNLARIKKPGIGFSLQLGGDYKEIFYSRQALRTDISGVGPELELATDAVMRTKTFTQNLGIYHKWFRLTLEGEHAEIDVRNTDGTPGTTRSIYRVLPSLEPFTRWVDISYKTKLLSPSMMQLLPNPDWQNPTYIMSGNPALDFGIGRELSVDWRIDLSKAYRKDTAQSLPGRASISIDASWLKNPVVLSAQIDSTGISYLTPENVPETFALNGSTGITRDLRPRVTFGFKANHHWQKFDYRRNDVLYTMSSNETEGSLSIRYKGKRLETGAMATYNRVMMDFTREKAYVRTMQSIVFSTSVVVKFSENFLAHARLDQVPFYGPEGSPPRSIPLVTASLVWKGTKKFPVSVSVEANDLLGRNVLYMRTGGIGMVQQTSGWAPGRYVTVSASWRISKSRNK